MFIEPEERFDRSLHLLHWVSLQLDVERVNNDK